MVEVVARYEDGEWNDALEDISRSAGASVSGPVRPYYESWATARIAVPRGEIAAANAAAEQALATGRRSTRPAKPASGRTRPCRHCRASRRRHGQGSRSRRRGLGGLAQRPARERLDASRPDAAPSAVGRTEEVVSIIDQMRLRSGWHEAALAIVERDYRRAAEIYERVGARPAEAEARLDAADSLIHQGEIEEGTGSSIEASPSGALSERPPRSRKQSRYAAGKRPGRRRAAPRGSVGFGSCEPSAGSNVNQNRISRPRCGSQTHSGTVPFVLPQGDALGCY